MPKISVVTATYNRANTIHRVYDSLKKQTYKDFEWIVIDDGSKDNTRNIIYEYINEDKIDITYIYQENSGKHMAVNKALSIAKGEFFTVLDSDDECVPEALEVFIKYWDEIEDKSKYKSITCRVYNPETKEPEGDLLSKKGSYVDAYSLDANFKLKLSGEKWSLDRIEVVREFPFPDYKKYKGGNLHYIPEAIIYDAMSRKYMERYINEPLRGYYHDQDNAITNRSTSRSNSNYYLWKHNLNDIIDYFLYNPLFYLKSAIGLVMDGPKTGRPIKVIIKDAKGFISKTLVIISIPLGILMSKKV